MLKVMAGEQDQLPFEVPGSSLLEQPFRSVYFIENIAPDLPEQSRIIVTMRGSKKRGASAVYGPSKRRCNLNWVRSTG
jgi:hypothetical protein